MDIKFLLLVMAILLSISTTSASPRRIFRRPGPCTCPQKTAYFSNLAAPFPTFIETIDYVRNSPKPYCNCGCNDQLILPPKAAELPSGLGYFPSALPLVAKCFDPALDYLTTGAYLPVASPCDCLTLAAPVCPEIAPYVKPIIL